MKKYMPYIKNAGVVFATFILSVFTIDKVFDVSNSVAALIIGGVSLTVLIVFLYTKVAKKFSL